MSAVVPQPVLNSALEFWKSHPFYVSAVVLGLDVGLEGIGVCIRKGSEIIYAKTWQYDVPEAARLADRRQKRAWRHCRANRITRLNRLKQLFLKHGLHWHEDRDPELINSDPYILRYRAVKGDGNGLASAKAVSIAIRHCVTHRGYEYDYYNDEGSYPWGEATEFGKVMKELPNLWLTAEDAEKARREARELEWKDTELAEFDRLVAERTGGSEKLEARLAEHAKGDKNHRRKRAKGEAFPRAIVWEHLKKIARRHAHLISDAEGFIAALGVHPKKVGSKDDAIFFFHRKTPDEMRKHFEKKRARCPYAIWLGLGNHYIAEGGNLPIRQFRLLEFAASRDVELVVKGTKTRLRVPVGEELTRELLEWVEKNPAAKTQKECTEIIADLKSALEKKHNGKLAAIKASDLNEWFFKILRDLLAPSVANRRKNAGMSAAASEKLYTIGINRGFSREAVNAALSLCRVAEGDIPASLFDFRRRPQPDLYGVYPQVEFLLGQRVKKSKTRHGKKRGALAHDGKLQGLFRQLAPKLGGKVIPDFCVVETARDLPRNLKQKKEREALIKENEERRKKLFQKYHLADDGNPGSRTRIELFDQQEGRCPFTGDELPQPGTTEYAALDVEHLFPQSKGGLSINENRVLTSARVNRELKKNQTPRAFAEAQGIPFDTIVGYTKAMRWGKAKREIFAWDSEEIPPFGNTTRTSQLAKQLHAEIAAWMNLGHNADLIAKQIGTPTGFLTAACRREWKLPMKDRSELTHHLVDAVILSHIPPQLGQNYLHPKSIFVPSNVTTDRQVRTVLGVLPLGPSSSTVEGLVAPDAAVCPVERHRSSSPHRSLHKQLPLGIFRSDNGTKSKRSRLLLQRKPLDRNTTLDAAELESRLIAMGIGSALRPSRSELERWLSGTNGLSQLTLNDGSVVNVTYAGDLSFACPFGFTCRLNELGDWEGIREFNERYSAVEMWRDINEKGRQFYVTQRRPTRPALRALLALGLRWFRQMSRSPEWSFAPDHPAALHVVATLRYLKGHPQSWNRILRRTEAQLLLRALIDLGFDADGKEPGVRWDEFHSVIWGKPVTNSARPALKEDDRGNLRAVTLRKGDAFLLSLTRGGDIASKPEDTFAKRWYRVTALKTDGKIEFKMLLEKAQKDTDGKKARKSEDGFRQTLEKTAPADLARLLNLPPLHDPSPRPPARKPRSNDSSGQTPLGFE